MTRVHVTLLFVVALVLSLPAGAMGDTVEGVDVQRLEREIRCPTCNAPLAVSDAPVSRQIKEEIRKRVARGEDEATIKAALIADFGPEVLATPPKSGFNLIAWLVPALAVLIGLAAIPVITRSWAKRGKNLTATTPEDIDATPEELERLNQELQRHD